MSFRHSLLPLAALVVLAAPAEAGTVSTVAGGGLTRGDGGPATSGHLVGIEGVAVDPAGNLFIADFTDARVRRVDRATGIITTVAGNGGYDWGPFGGAGTDAQIGTPISVAADAAGHVFVLDFNNTALARVDIATGTITEVAAAGWNPTNVDPTPVHDCGLADPQGLAVDSHGDLYIADTGSDRVRKYTLSTGTVTTIAGAYTRIAATNDGASGDGGPASLAAIVPMRLAFDAQDNLFVLGNNRVRRIDHATSIITTVAGGGTGAGLSGSALDAAMPNATDIQVSPDGHTLWIASLSYIWKVDLVAGTISVVAGTPGVSGNSGDGGPAAAALFGQIRGLALAANGDLYVSDYVNSNVRRIAADAAAGGFVVTGSTTQSALDSLLALSGGLSMTGQGGVSSLLAPNLSSVGGSLTIDGNASLTALGLPSLTSVGGDVTICDNASLAAVSVTALHTVGGSLTVCTPPDGSIALQSPQISGGANLSGGSISATSITADSTIVISTVDSGSVTVPGGMTSYGSVIISTGNGTPSMIGGMTTYGSVVISTGGGSPSVMGGMTTYGSVVITAGGVSSVTMGGITTYGSVTISAGGGSPVTMGSGSVGGDLTVSASSPGASLSLSGVAVDGNSSITTSGADSVLAQTAGLTTAVALTNGAATMQVTLPTNTFAAPVQFSVAQVDPATLPVTGVSATGAPTTLGTVAAYTFTFAVPTLNADASLAFDIRLADLSPADQTALLAALAAGTATVATIGDAPGSPYQAFAVCQGGAEPSAGGCVAVTALDSLGQLAATGTMPATIHFEGIVGHFSTWSVVVPTAVTGVKPPHGAPHRDRGAAMALAVRGAVGGVAHDVAYTLPSPQSGALRVFDVAGHVVRTLADGLLPAGPQVVRWDGRDAAGRSAGAGVYLVQLRTTSGTRNAKMLQLR